MSEPIPSLAEAMAEIRRLRAEIERLRERAWENARQEMIDMTKDYARIAALEAEVAIARGTLAKPTEDEPSRFTCNVPPSAPPHGKPMSILEYERWTSKALKMLNEPENDDE